MRIVMLLARSTGGIGTHVDDLTRELRVLGHHVVLATDPVTAVAFGWEDAELLWPAGGALKRDAHDGQRIGARRARLARLRTLLGSADVVHAHGHQAGSLAALVVSSLSRRRRPALVVSLHNAVLGRVGRQRLGSITAKPFAVTAQLVTGASSDLVEQARAWGAGWAELAAVPSPLVPDLLRREPLGRGARRELARTLLEGAGIPAAPTDRDLILTVARIAPQKDLPTLVASAARGRLAQRDAESREGPIWVVVGGGDARLAEQLREQTHRLQAPLHFIGPQRDPAPWLRAASLFVLTSHWEARALVVQEALAAGTPVVARDAGGLRDLVDGVGVLIDTSDPGAWSRAVGELLSDGDAWHTASVAGRDRATGWDDSRATATRWVSWYARARAMT